MKKIKLNLAKIKAVEILSREELKNVLGGMGSDIGSSESHGSSCTTTFNCGGSHTISCTSELNVCRLVFNSLYKPIGISCDGIDTIC